MLAVTQENKAKLRAACDNGSVAWLEVLSRLSRADYRIHLTRKKLRPRLGGNFGGEEGGASKENQGDPWGIPIDPEGKIQRVGQLKVFTFISL